MANLIECRNANLILNDTIILKDFSIKVERGDVLIIVGKNGSGKTSLLKFLSGGFMNNSIEIHGVPSTLINIRGGFNDFLSLKDNIIYLGLLYGIIGAPKEKYFKTVLEIAEIEPRYLDMRLTRLSPGTIMRTAFAISLLYSETCDFLVMDEWLSVGDVNFKNKANKLMRDLVDTHGLSVILATNSEVPKLNQKQRVFNLDTGTLT